MSEDRPGSGVPAGGLSEGQVARLLGAAGPVEPTPPEVVSRMDAVLADLVAARSAGGDTAPTPKADAEAEARAEAGAEAGPASPAVSLDTERARRRRTWGPRLLVAAAALGVAGVGLSVVDDLTGASGSDSASAGDAAGAQSESSEAGGSSESGAGSDRGQARRESGEADASDDADALDQPDRASESARAPRVPRLLRISDDADLRAAVRGTAAGDVATLSDLGDLGDLAADRAGSGGCLAPGGPGRRTLVSYQGDPATLVVRRTGDRLDGRVYDCDLGLQLDGVEIGPAGE